MSGEICKSSSTLHHSLIRGLGVWGYLQISPFTNLPYGATFVYCVWICLSTHHPDTLHK